MTGGVTPPPNGSSPGGARGADASRAEADAAADGGLPTETADAAGFSDGGAVSVDDGAVFDAGPAADAIAPPLCGDDGALDPDAAEGCAADGAPPVLAADDLHECDEAGQ